MGDRAKTYKKILQAMEAVVVDSTDGEDDQIGMEIDAILARCEKVQDDIDAVYLANANEVKSGVKTWCKANGKGKDVKFRQKLTKETMEKLTEVAMYWKDKRKVHCYDCDYILDWTLDGCVFTNSSVRKSD